MKFAKAILCVLIVSLLVSMALPMASAKKPPKPPPDEEPPADPAIAFHTSKGGEKIWVMNADGSNQAVVYEWPYMISGAPSWSPDGESIAWAGSYSTDGIYLDYYGVWRIDVEVIDGVPQGNNLQQLVSIDANYGATGSAAWSPLGDVIAYNARLWYPDDVFKIDAVPATGGDPFTIYASPDGFGIRPGSSVTWRSDGSQFAFTGGEIAAGADGFSIIIIDRATSTVVHTLLTGQHPDRFDWAQDLDILAFGSSSGICTVDIETETVVQVVEGSNPSWSPDNSKIAYQRLGRGQRHNTICTYEFSTGDITPLTRGGTVTPDWQRL